jgi:bifunctional non-homologous end joining protein LigD
VAKELAGVPGSDASGKLARIMSPRMRGVAFVPVMTAKAVSQLPEGDQWEYEAKLDGYRCLLLRDRTEVRLRSRNDKDLTRTFPSIVAAGGRMPVRQAVVDGEIVALDNRGRPSFQALQHPSKAQVITFFAFDLLYLNGQDLTHLSLEKRRAMLPVVADDSGIQLSLELPGSSSQVVAAVRELELEGVIAKRRDSPYDADLQGAWLKFKIEREQEFVIGGYRGGQSAVETLLVGYYEGKAFRFAAKVNAGFTPYIRRDLFAKLNPSVSTRCPFIDLPNSKSSRWGGGVTAQEMSSITWVVPKVLAQIRFLEWTVEGRLRHPSFVGLRTDKSARDVHREPG